MAKQTVALSVDSFEDQGYNNKKWHRYQVVSSGETKLVLVPPDCEYSMKQGDTIHVMEGQWDSWIIDKNKLPGGSPSSNGSSGKGGGGRDYSEFNDYQMNVRDPQIALQSWGDKVFSFYLACLPFLKEKPDNIDAIDDLIDQAYTKSLEIQDRITTRFATKNAETE